MYFFRLLGGLSWIQGTIVVVTIFVTFSVVGVYAMHRFFNRKAVKGHHDVAGYVFTNFGVLYSVLLGFTVVNAQQRFDKMNQTTQVEAGYLLDLYRDAQVFPEKDREGIHLGIKTYITSVINDEWQLMAGGVLSDKTIDAVDGLWNSYYAINPSNKREEVWYVESVSKLNQFMNARLARIIGSEESLGAEMWTLLILGGIIIAAFIWIFSLESLLLHMLMASILSGTIGFMLFLIYSLDTAFSGDVSVKSTALERILDSFK